MYATIGNARGFTGDSLIALADRPRPESPLEGILDPEPSLHILVGQAKSGKTTFTATLAVAAAAGSKPWPTAMEMEPSQVLFVSAEQSATRVVGLLERAGDAAGLRRESWASNLTLLARDRELPRLLSRIFTLDAGGCQALEDYLKREADSGRPIRYVFLDSLSRMAPPGMDENDNAAVTEYGDWLATLAHKHKAYIVAIHHTGHSEQYRARGASAYTAVSQVNLTLKLDRRDPRRRTLVVRGNAIPESGRVFAVAGDDRPAGYVDYFRPVLTLAEELDAAMPEGEASSIAEVARKVRLRRGESGLAAKGKSSGGLRKQIADCLQKHEGSAVEARGAGTARRWVRIGSLAEAARGDGSEAGEGDATGSGDGNAAGAEFLNGSGAAAEDAGACASETEDDSARAAGDPAAF